MATAKRKDTLNCARFQKTQKGPMDIILLSPSIFDYVFWAQRGLGRCQNWQSIGEKIISKESNVVTWVAVTSSPQFSRALCTEIGLAGAPLVVVNATQYEIAGQSDLLTFVKLPSSHC